MNTNCFPIPTPYGTFWASYSEHGLESLRFPEMDSKAGDQLPPEPWHRLTCEAVQAVLAGRNPESLPPLDLSAHTAFRRSVWKAMQQIPSGSTLSYGELAREIGQPNAFRAVGGACGANPILVLIPCHRVLANHQRLGGFSSGLEWKERLLQIEGVSYRKPGSIATRLAA